MNHDSRATSTCPYCAQPAATRLVTVDLNRRIAPDHFEYRECHTCGLIYLHNAPDDLGAWYPDKYHHVPVDVGELAAGAEFERYKIDLVKRFKTGGQLIEIGPAAGSFAFLAKQAGFAVTAIEMNPRCCTFLRDVVGVEAIESRDEIGALRASPRADVIALWHVIEHLRRPWELVRVAAERLNPGGILVIAAPNPQSLQFRMTGRRWVHIDAPRHVTLPSPDFIERAAHSDGLMTLLRTTRDPGSLGWNEFGWRFFAMAPFRQLLLRRVAGRLGRIWSALMAPLESREGRGTAYTLILQKPGP